MCWQSVDDVRAADIGEADVSALGCFDYDPQENSDREDVIDYVDALRDRLRHVKLA